MNKQERISPVAVWFAACSFVLLGLVSGTGCTREQVGEDYLIRVGSLTLTLSEFNQEVRTATEEAFPGETEIDLTLMSDLRLRLLNQMGEELMLAAFAADHDIAISQEEIDARVAAIKADYPDDTFEETLLENAISFQLWRRQLAARLLAEKVISREVMDRVRITSEDVAEYYATHYPKGISETEDVDDIKQRIVIHLRRQKAELAYKEWINALHESYPVEINRQVWDRWMGGEL